MHFWIVKNAYLHRFCKTWIPLYHYKIYTFFTLWRIRNKASKNILTYQLTNQRIEANKKQKIRSLGRKQRDLNIENNKLIKNIESNLEYLIEINIGTNFKNFKYLVQYLQNKTAASKTDFSKICVLQELFLSLASHPNLFSNFFQLQKSIGSVH